MGKSFENQDLELSLSLCSPVMPVQSCPQLTSYTEHSQSIRDRSWTSLSSQNNGVTDLSNSSRLSNKGASNSTTGTNNTQKSNSVGSKEMLDRFKKLIIHVVDFLTLSRKCLARFDIFYLFVGYLCVYH